MFEKFKNDLKIRFVKKVILPKKGFVGANKFSTFLPGEGMF